MSRSNQSGPDNRSNSRSNQPTPPQQTTTTTSLSALEALLSLDSSINKSVRERNGRDYSTNRPSLSRRLSTSGSRSRDRSLSSNVNLSTTSESNNSGISSTTSQFGTPPPLLPNLSNNWLQRERLAQQGGGNGSNNSSGFWSGIGGEALPSNAVAGYSAFNTFADGSHFFPPGSSAFSFEGGLLGREGGDEDSPSLFRDSRIKSTIRSSSRYSLAPEEVETSWEQDEVINKRAGIGLMGGGRKRKDSSRGLSYAVTTSNMTGDKGLMALAKPVGDALDGRVAVAGKTCLRILKVPSGERTTSSFERPSSAFKSFSGLAARRSQARGSPVSLDRNLTPDEKSSIVGEKYDSATSSNEIVETLDVRFGSRLGPSFFFSDVKWGYGATSGKIATAFSNGAVVLWDLAKEGSSRVDQLKYEHDRAVNKVVFGGASGSWLLSGGQDGQMKLWDIREARPASLVLKASSPVRQLSFSPSASQPFTLLAVLSSGTLIRYDIRYTGRVAGGATDRIAGHVGACLSMDWRDNLPSESDRASGGWVVTGGMDNTIKIWDFSQTTLSTKPTTTLFASQPVQSVSWHPTRATELASSPLPTLSVGMDEGNNSPGINSMGMELGKEALGSSWKNEIEIWDTRRSFFPKLSIKTDEPISAIVYNDDDTIWSTSKSTPTFQQFDINSDSYAIIDSMPLAGASWNIEGELVFVDDARSTHDIPWDPPDILNNTIISIDNAQFRPESSIGSILNFDPDFSANSFTYLANNLVLAGYSLGEICDINAEASEYVGRSDAAQLWSTIRIWLDDTPLLPPEPEVEATESQYQTPHLASAPLPVTFSTPTLRASDNITTSPLQDISATIVPSSRRSFSSSHNRSRSAHDSPVILPFATLDSPKVTASSNHHLDDFSEESASEADIILPPAAMKVSTITPVSYSFSRPTYNPDQLSTSSGSESALSTTHKPITSGTPSSLLLLGSTPRSLSNSLTALSVGRRGRSMTLSTGLVGSSTTSRLLDSMLDLDSQLQQRRSSTPTPGNIGSLTAANLRSEDNWEFDLPSPGGITTKLSTPRPLSVDASIPRTQTIENSSDSDDSDDDRVEEVTTGGVESTEVEDERFAKLRAAKLLARQSTKIRRTSGGSKTRPTLNGSNNVSVLGLSRQSSMNQKKNSIGIYANGEKKEQEATKGPSMKELKKIAGEEKVSEVKEIVKEQIIAALIEYADRGDSQLCASVCCVLSEQNFDFDLIFVARVTKAYLDLLRRSKLYASAAGLLKYCAIDSLRSQTQNNIVHHMACGKCGKAIESPPYGTCHRCSNQITRCCICHSIVRSLLLFCPICNHGAHMNCVTSTSAILGSRLESLNSLSSSNHPHNHPPINPKEESPNNSHPSTPGLPMTANSSMPAIRAWFWNEEGKAIEGTEGGIESNEEIERREIENLIGRCPGCSHAGCLLAVAVE